MEVHSSKQGLLGIDDDLGLDGPPKRPKQSASLCRICYGVFTVVTVTVALIFTLIVVGDLLGIYAVRSNNNHENGGYSYSVRYYIFGEMESTKDDSRSSPFSPPPYQEKAKTARYIVHNTDWGTVSTLSVKLKGVPFGTPESFCDGPLDNSTGVPYFYLTPDSLTVKDARANPSMSLTLSEAQTGYCVKHKWDPEDPQCGRVCLSGKMVELTKGSQEEQFAKNSLFARHPQMRDWPSSHDWLVLKLDITNVWMLDYYGPSTDVPVKDYFDAKV